MSIPEKIQREVASLRKSINHHNKLYHALDNPEIPDSDYDSLVERLETLEREYGLLSDSSPSLSVGSAPLNKFAEVKHQIPMLSLDKVFEEYESEGLRLKLIFEKKNSQTFKDLFTEISRGQISFRDSK